jgi:hypothetical protein
MFDFGDVSTAYIPHVVVFIIIYCGRIFICQSNVHSLFIILKFLHGAKTDDVPIATVPLST